MLWIWLFLILGFYPYFMYPCLVWLVSKIKSCPTTIGAIEPSVTVVVAAFNEREHIYQTVMNKLGQDYPKEKLRVMIVSDASDDGTDEIVRELAAQESRVTFIRQQVRAGKTAALNRAIQDVTTDLIVFADANSMYEKDAVANLTSRFADPEVGYVSGKMLYSTDESTTAGSGSSAYMQYENKLRMLESKIGSVVGVDGGIDAVRRSLYKPMRCDQLPDFVLPLSVVAQGFRVVFAENAILREDALEKSSAEYKMRVRVATRALWALIDFRRLLNPFRFGLFSWQLLSHKWMRYLSFAPLAFAAVLTFGLTEKSQMLDVFKLGIITFLIMSGAAWGLPKVAERVAIARWCLYFLLLNIASFVGVVNVIRGERFITWKPRQG